MPQCCRMIVIWRFDASIMQEVAEALVADHELTGLLQSVAERFEPVGGFVDALLRQSVEPHQSRRRLRALHPPCWPRRSAQQCVGWVMGGAGLPLTWPPWRRAAGGRSHARSRTMPVKRARCRPLDETR
eukprot:4419095-Pyramimonas_sp.AAC.1